MNCDEFAWPIYIPTDDVEEYDNTIESGRYYVERNERFALEGNGWYCDIVVQKAPQYKLITEQDIEFQLKASRELKPNHSKHFQIQLRAVL